ncbi:WSC domain-containing protein [Tricladium varicosporioides]|nr:WSC domain-containing protein [Hymenoscyphus varicosporioides]
MSCAGNVSETCGGGNRLSVYSTAGGAAPPPAPVHVASAPPFTRLGCYTEGNNTRALSGFQQYDYSGMTVEKCAAICAATPYTFMGVEYGGECYCGLQPQFNKSGSVAVPDTQCSILCAGNSTEYCGAGNRLDLYRIPPVAEA